MWSEPLSDWLVQKWTHKPPVCCSRGDFIDFSFFMLNVCVNYIACPPTHGDRIVYSQSRIWRYEIRDHRPPIVCDVSCGCVRVCVCACVCVCVCVCLVALWLLSWCVCVTLRCPPSVLWCGGPRWSTTPRRWGRTTWWTTKTSSSWWRSRRPSPWRWALGPALFPVPCPPPPRDASHNVLPSPNVNHVEFVTGRWRNPLARV